MLLSKRIIDADVLSPVYTESNWERSMLFWAEIHDPPSCFTWTVPDSTISWALTTSVVCVNHINPMMKTIIITGIIKRNPFLMDFDFAFLLDLISLLSIFFTKISPAVQLYFYIKRFGE